MLSKLLKTYLVSSLLFMGVSLQSKAAAIPPITPIYIDSPKVLVILLHIKKQNNTFQVVQCNTKIVNGSKKINESEPEKKANDPTFLVEIFNSRQKIVYTQYLNESFTETLEFVNNQGALEKKQTAKDLIISLLKIPLEGDFNSIQISSITSANQKQLIYQTILKPID